MTERPHEFALIAELFAPLAAGSAGALGLTDDAALIDVATGDQLVVTTDCMIAGVHFLSNDAPETVAHRVLRSNLSDLAAMGAAPAGYTMALALPSDQSLAWIERFAATLGADQTLFKIGLLGGDTVGTPGPLTISITAFGTVPAGKALRRDGAQPNDDIWVSGTIGDAGLGLAIQQSTLEVADTAALETLVARYAAPTPRLELGAALRGIATAAIDVSDGLIADLGHICKTSGVGADIAVSAVPLSGAAQMLVAENRIDQKSLWSSGDDYELVFTAPAQAAASVERAAAGAGTPVARLGKIIKGDGVTIRDPAGARISIDVSGYRHF